MKHSSTKRRTPHPPGFTMVELLVVIGIIIFLVGIMVNVVTNALTTAKEKRTVATIRKINGLLTQRMDAFTMAMHDINAANPPSYVSDPLFPTSLYPFLSANRSAQQLTPGNPHRAKVLGQKALFRSMFPQSLVEAGQSVPSGDDPTTQSSEALYLFLTKMEAFDHPAVDENAFDSQEVADTDGDGLKEFVDGWGRPLRFYRWPTRLIRPGNPATTAQSVASSGSYTNTAVGNPPAAYFGPANAGHDASIFFASLPNQDTQEKDPDDPLGTILKSSWSNWKFNDGSGLQTMTPAVFENAPSHSTPGFGLSTPETWSLPLIVSAGPDGRWGLHDMNDADNYGHLAQPQSVADGLDGILDNLSNRNLAP